MRPLKTFIFATVAILPLAGTALAADPYNYNNNQYNQGGYAVPTKLWEGGYLGMYLGYGWGTFGTNKVGDIDNDAAHWGIYGGYNFQSGDFVYGLEADGGYAWNEGKKRGIKGEQGLEGSLRGRLGVSLGSWMPYGTVGLAVSETKFDSKYANDESKTRFGWTAGLGVETFLTQNITGRIEYRYTDFGDKRYDLGGTSVKSDITRSDLRIGIGLKF